MIDFFRDGGGNIYPPTREEAEQAVILAKKMALSKKVEDALKTAGLECEPIKPKKK